MDRLRSWLDGRRDFAWLVGGAAFILVVTQLSDHGTTADLLFLAPAFLAFVLRATVPRLPAEAFAAMVLVPVVYVVGERRALEGSLFLVVNMVLAVSWSRISNRRAAAIATAAVVAPWLLSVHLADGEIGWEAWTSASAFTFLLGRLLRRQQALITELEATREALAEQAVAEERRRIARELHDLAGHTLAAVLLHVTGARHVLHRDLDEAERALLDAESIGRSSLDQIRAAVGVLRTDERGTDPALAGGGQLPALLDEYRRAGLEVTADVAPAAADLEGPVGTAVHRIVREALANVARHAPTNAVEVELVVDGAEREVRLVVADHGRPARSPAVTGMHFGIIGMRERAHALGGELDARPTDDGWRVEARLPTVTIATTPAVQR